MEASSGLSTAALAVSPQMQQTRQSLEANQAALARRISNQVLGGEPLDVVWNLTLAANLISANIPYGKVEEIQAMPGVASWCWGQYEPAVYSQGPADPNMSTSAEMIGSSAAYAAGLTGAGTRIAVIDTGTDTDHQSPLTPPPLHTPWRRMQKTAAVLTICWMRPKSGGSWPS